MSVNHVCGYLAINQITSSENPSVQIFTHLGGERASGQKNVVTLEAAQDPQRPVYPIKDFDLFYKAKTGQEFNFSSPEPLSVSLFPPKLFGVNMLERAPKKVRDYSDIPRATEIGCFHPDLDQVLFTGTGASIPNKYANVSG